MAADDALRYPSATAVTFVLLTVAVLLTGAFVGDWMYLSISGSAGPTPVVWLLAPMVLAVVATGALALAAPWRIERRDRLVDVPADLGAVALARLDVLAAAARVRRPRLRWNPDADGAAAMVYGRPGAYRLSVTPVLLGAARRRPESYDAVVRHELAHLRHHDVLLAYAAVSAWWAAVGLLVVPLAWRVVDRDLSMVPEYLVRSAVLAVAVMLLRASLLRSREHEADLRAASWSPTPEGFAELVAAAGARQRGARTWLRRSPLGRLLAMHPDVEARVRAIRVPGWAVRARAVEFFASGLLAGVAVPLIRSLVVGFTEGDLRTADPVADAIAFGALGAYCAVSFARAAGAGGLTGWARGLPVLAAVVGVAGGVAVSLGSTALLSLTPADVAARLVTGVLVGAVVVVVADLALVVAGPSPLRILLLVALAAGAAALAADAAFALAALLVSVGPEFVWTYLLGFFGTTPAAALLGLVLLVGALGAVALGRPSGPGRRRTRWLRAPVSGTVAGLIATGWMVAVLRMIDRAGATDVLATDLICLWIVVGTGVAASSVVSVGEVRRSVDGVVAGAVALTVGTLGWALVFVISGVPVPVADVVHTWRLVAGMTTVVGLPVMALVSLLTPRRSTSAGPAYGMVGLAVVTVAPAAVLYLVRGMLVGG